MDTGGIRQHHPVSMPFLDLSDLELETAARACRALAYQEELAARTMQNPTMRAPIESTAKRAAALAEKFERARKVSAARSGGECSPRQ